jgi:5'-3' exonuclease
MGIPSYYRTLIQKMPHAIKRRAPNVVQTLVVDMNCMIYHVLREPKMLAHTYPSSPELVLAWEHTLQKEVCVYLTHIWRAAGAPLKTYIALDGVVPYAKIKQQRFRRFKSAAAKSAATESWDTNAITPGTNFMREMAEALRATGSRFNWIISDTDDPGEGEHKVLKWLLSTQLTPGPIVVYGLDADLILLCLLAGDKLGDKYPILLLREAMAFGKLVRPAEQEEVDLCFFQVSTLRDSLQRGKAWSREQFYDYIFGMSFCGNDFLPTGLSLRIRDDGHAILLDALNALWSANIHLVSFDEAGIARPRSDGLKAFAQFMAREEEHLILQTIRRKSSSRFGESDDDNLPLIEQAERPLVVYDYITLRVVSLKPQWCELYNKLALGDSSIEQRKQRAADFWTGWCWILDYYQGRRVDLEWVYPVGYPPTWRDLVSYFALPEPDSWKETIPLQPKEQLALVLPMSSWNLMLKTPFRNLPTAIPQFWPQGFALETFAKRFGWECEPMIPMLTPERLRYEVTRMNPIR